MVSSGAFSPVPRVCHVLNAPCCPTVRSFTLKQAYLCRNCAFQKFLTNTLKPARALSEWWNNLFSHSDPAVAVWIHESRAWSMIDIWTRWGDRAKKEVVPSEQERNVAGFSTRVWQLTAKRGHNCIAESVQCMLKCSDNQIFKMKLITIYSTDLTDWNIKTWRTLL
jgi:hypothetical protein